MQLRVSSKVAIDLLGRHRRVTDFGDVHRDIFPTAATGLFVGSVADRSSSVCQVDETPNDAILGQQCLANQRVGEKVREVLDQIVPVWILFFLLPRLANKNLQFVEELFRGDLEADARVGCSRESLSSVVEDLALDTLEHEFNNSSKVCAPLGDVHQLTCGAFSDACAEPSDGKRFSCG